MKRILCTALFLIPLEAGRDRYIAKLKFNFFDLIITHV